MGGLGQKLKELRKSAWERDKATNSIPPIGTKGQASWLTFLQCCSKRGVRTI